MNATQTQGCCLQAQEIMTPDPACCESNTPLYQVAQIMAQHDCGAIPVVENLQNRKLVGIVTDRDITCRMVARRKSPQDEWACDCMSSPAVRVMRDASVEECCRTMKQYQIRRLLVVDAQGQCCGLIALADLVGRVSTQEAADLLQAVSRLPQSRSRYHRTQKVR